MTEQDKQKIMRVGVLLRHGDRQRSGSTLKS